METLQEYVNIPESLEATLGKRRRDSKTNPIGEEISPINNEHNMKITPTQGRIHLRFLTRTLALAALIGAGVVAFGDDTKIDQLRAEADKLMRKAEELKARGAGDEAGQLARKADELRRNAKIIEKERSQPKERQDAAPREQQEKLDRLHEKLNALLAAGRKDDAAALKKEFAELQRGKDRGPGPDQLAEARERLKLIRQEIEELRGHGRNADADRLEERARQMKEKIAGAEGHRDLGPGGPKPLRPEHPRSPGQPGSGPSQEIERRLQHLKVAIENLHAAGLHEHAERLTQDAERMHQKLVEQQRGMVRGPEFPKEPFQALQGEIQELRQSLQELRQQLEELRRKR